VVFISDRVLLASQTVDHIPELGDSKVILSIADGGRQGLEGEHATVCLGPDEDLKTVDLGTLQFDLHIDVPDHVVPEGYDWITRARVELGQRSVRGLQTENLSS
jgi:hypothetical protein